jgi:hypothetical protein
VNDQKLFADYLRKCFVSVDGLWFMKVEEDADFEKALALDIAVWKVIPKIEARAIQELLNLGKGIEALRQALDFKLSAELYRFDLTQISLDSFVLEVHGCPWVEQIKKANRQHFLERISDTICPAEYRTFTDEFGKDLKIEHLRDKCLSDGCCRFLFQEPR